MYINVSCHEETIINQLVEAGGYTSTSEWLQAVIFDQMLQANPEYKAELDASLDTALADIEAGKGEPLDDVVATLKADVRQHYQLD